MEKGQHKVAPVLIMLIMVPSRIFVFGRAESGDEVIVPSVKGERAVDGDSERDVHGGSVDGTTSSDDVDSERVEAALLGGESQRVCYSQRTDIANSPVSSWPPTKLGERPYGLVRRQRQSAEGSRSSIFIFEMSAKRTSRKDLPSTRQCGAATRECLEIFL